jgi:outer membrane protein assembly factor BamB
MWLRFTCLFLSFVHCCFADADDNWPRLRGARADGVSADDPRLPESWSQSDNVAWKVDVPGLGWGSPIVWGDRVFVTSVVADKETTRPKKGLYQGFGVRKPKEGIHHWMVYCYSLQSGQKLWEQESHAGQPVVPRHPKSSYAAETPTTDGERLYVVFGDLGVYCYDLDGTPVWNRPIEPRKTFLDYGAAASPVVYKGQVIVVYDNVTDSWISSYDAKTGDELWKVEREETHSWATPFVWQNDVRTELIVPGRIRNRSYDLNGKLLWEFDGRMSNLVIPSPFAAHGMCYITSGYVGDAHRPVYAVKPGASGDITNKKEPGASEFIGWYLETGGPYNTTPLVYGDRYFTLYDQGFFTCHNAKTGEKIYGKNRFTPSGSFTASPWAYNGKVFCLSEDGMTYVLDASDDFRILATNDLDELALATPSVAQGRLLIRTASSVYCLTNKTE